MITVEYFFMKECQIDQSSLILDVGRVSSLLRWWLNRFRKADFLLFVCNLSGNKPGDGKNQYSCNNNPNDAMRHNAYQERCSVKYNDSNKDTEAKCKIPDRTYNWNVPKECLYRGKNHIKTDKH